MRAGKVGSSLAATSHHHVPEEHTSGYNSSISEALHKTSSGETLTSSKHSQSLATASKVHSRVCQDKSTLQRKPQTIWRSLFHHSLQKVQKVPLVVGGAHPQQPSQGSLARSNKLPTGRTRQKKQQKNWTRCQLDWPVIPFAKGRS